MIITDLISEPNSLFPVVGNRCQAHYTLLECRPRRQFAHLLIVSVGSPGYWLQNWVRMDMIAGPG